mgnify:FL=1
MTPHFENFQVGAVHVDGSFRAILTTPENETVWTSKESFTDITKAYLTAHCENIRRCEFRCRMVIAVERGMEVGS